MGRLLTRENGGQTGEVDLKGGRAQAHEKSLAVGFVLDLTDTLAVGSPHDHLLAELVPELPVEYGLPVTPLVLGEDGRGMTDRATFEVANSDQPVEPAPGPESAFSQIDHGLLVGRISDG